MSTIAFAHVYDRLDVALLADSKDPQARWIAEQLADHPEDQLLLCFSSTEATIYVGAGSLEEAVEALVEARGELHVADIELRGRDDVLAPIRAALSQR
jgi:hypothetical protein